MLLRILIKDDYYDEYDEEEEEEYEEEEENAGEWENYVLEVTVAKGRCGDYGGD